MQLGPVASLTGNQIHCVQTYSTDLATRLCAALHQIHGVRHSREQHRASHMPQSFTGHGQGRHIDTPWDREAAKGELTADLLTAQKTDIAYVEFDQ